jgi:hypothetical protein
MFRDAVRSAGGVGAVVRRAAVTALALVVGAVALAPAAAEAQRRGAGRPAGGAGFSGASHRGVHHGAPGPRGFGHRRFGGVVLLAPPLFWYGSDFSGDPGYASTPAYAPAYGPSVVYAPSPGSLSVAPPAPPTPPPTVVELPTGRWELRGDGINVPYRWVWIPNPPTAPPSGPSDGGAPGPSSRPEPPGNTRVYRWTDAEGTLHLTDRLDQVPPRYRPPARAPKPS